VGHGHPCAIDSPRIWEQDHSASLLLCQFLCSMVHQILSGAQGSEPEDSSEYKGLLVLCFLLQGCPA
jgi:hypothetical protein